MMKFEQQTMEELFDNNVRIENVFYMQLLTSSDSMPDSFWDVFEYDCEEIMIALGHGQSDLSDYDDLQSKTALMEYLHDRRIGGVLVKFSLPVPRNFVFNDKGEFSGCSIGWGMSTWMFAYADDLKEAINIAIKMAEDYFQECTKAEKAKLDKVVV